jgi:hypothetical protein
MIRYKLKFEFEKRSYININKPLHCLPFSYCYPLTTESLGLQLFKLRTLLWDRVHLCVTSSYIKLIKVVVTLDSDKLSLSVDNDLNFTSLYGSILKKKLFVAHVNICGHKGL